MYPKRLIEVDLPIKRISAHARREKSIRHGHISTLHIWWARRPLAACRAVICAALWPDPADELCPQAFRDAAAALITTFAAKASTNERLSSSCSAESLGRWLALNKPEARLDPTNPAHLNVLRHALLDFIADFSNWDNSTVPEYLETARALTQAAHQALGGEPGTRPLVVDPFAGGGAIPLEALRVGADAFASDLNPVAVLLNKVVLEYIPKYGQRLADEVRTWGEWIKQEAEKELGEFYPKDPDGATPIAYLWARTITCEGPGCGAEVPLMRSLWLSKKASRSTALQFRVNRDVQDRQDKLKNPVHPVHPVKIEFEIIQKQGNKWVSLTHPKSKIADPKFDGTVRRGSATCPVCGYTTPVARVRVQLKERKGGTADARLFCVVMTHPAEQGRFYRLPTERDLQAVEKAKAELERRKAAHTGPLSLVPDEKISLNEIRRISVLIYGMTAWGELFTPRQSLALTTLAELVRKAGKHLSKQHDENLAVVVQTILALALDKQADSNSSVCTWRSASEDIGHTFGRQALPMMWDFVEGNVLGGATRDWLNAVEGGLQAIGSLDDKIKLGHAEQASATTHPLPDDSAQALITDPPYYDAVPYAHLSDFFYVWLRRTLGDLYPDLLSTVQVPKEAEIVVDRPHQLSTSKKDIVFYERELAKAFADGRRVLAPDGIGTIVFASKTTASWEAILQAVVDAGWTITGSWPIDTEMESRVAAQGQARLASSIHLVCRPRSDAEQQQTEIRNQKSEIKNVGDWRDVLQALPVRIHEWMPRLAQEGVVGADAIFACLGPALEIFSRYSRVEKASGEQVTLGEYLVHVWAAVSKEALTMIFAGADATGFEEDARLTAMWLWTLSTNAESKMQNAEQAEEDETEEDSAFSIPHSSFTLEYDAARKIAQGLGAHLESLTSMVQVKGDKARLLPVAERARYLFGKDEGKAPSPAHARRKAVKQLDLFETLGEAEQAEGGWGEKNAPKLGETVLDRLHQSMILFAAGRSEALKRFLVDEGVGRDQRFWRLAQAFSALYPSGTDEKRWVDGVLARKKGLGF